MAAAPNRIESSVTSISWIPSEAIDGLTKLPFELGFGHYDDPPPDVIDDLDALHAAGAFRFANRLRAWIEVADGEVVGWGHRGRSYISTTHMEFGRTSVAFQPTAFPDLRPEPVVTPSSVRFVQTAGGRPGVPAPRTVSKWPFVQWVGPSVWTTLALTINADGTFSGELTGATAFPRHWIYDDAGRLVAKSGLIDFDDWYHNAFGQHTPWGEEETPAFVTMAESALERQLSTTIMRGGERPELQRLPSGNVLFRQGDAGADLYLLLDGVLAIQVDGEKVAEVGPGAVVGERARLESGTRTSTVRAVTECRLARAPSSGIDRSALAALAEGHRREDAPREQGGPGSAG
jgi:Cyclic nucleotide-binding domain